MKNLKTSLLVTASVLVTSTGALWAQDATDSGVGDSDDVIVVTGIRASLQRGLDNKRNADSILDAISAEELGKFPDQNVAESLQRITGVAITRSRGGEGRFVTVRGLGQEFNTLTYNGRELATENIGREFSFDVIPSELISAAQVFKSPKASQTDGSIGGLVNIETAKPLNNPGLHGAFTLGGQYEDLGDSTGLKVSGVLSNTFANDTIGVIGSIGYQEREIRTDTAESIAIDATMDFNSDGVNDRLNSFNANINNEDRERLGATLAVQFQPNDAIDITIDGLYTNFESPSVSSSYSYFPNPGLATDVTVDSNNDVVSQTTNADPANPFSNIFDIVARRAEADTDTFQIGGNYKHQLTDQWSIEIDASYSEADGVRDNIGSNDGGGSFFVVSFPGANFTQTSSGRGVPSINFTARPTSTSTAQAPIDQLTADAARLHFSRNSSNEINDEVFTIKGDVKREFGNNGTVSFGFDYIDRTKGNKLFDNSDSGRFCGDQSISLPTLGADANAFICDRSIRFADLLTPDELSQLLTPFNGESEGFLSNTGADIPRNFVVPNIDIVRLAFDRLAELTGQPSFLTPTLNETSSNEVEEEILSVYGEVDFEGEFGNVPYTANAGVRLAYTDLTSSGAGAVLTGITIDNVSGNNAITVDNSGERVFNNDYFDVLPSFNIAFDLAENFKLRAGFSRSLARPTFNDLSTIFAVTQINAGQEEAAGANPLLEAVRSNNVDASLEWYGDNGLSLSGAVFYKDITDFITNSNTRQDIVIPNAIDLMNNPLPPQTVNFLVTSPQNGDTAEVYGLELAGQYLHDTGFGVVANITLAESDATSGGVDSQLENISDFSANTAVFYEANGIQARVALNHRSDFLSSTEGEGGFAEFTDDYTQIDFSASYNFEEFTGYDVSVFVEGINIADEEVFIFSEQPNFLETFQENGARYLFGVRGSF